MVLPAGIQGLRLSFYRFGGLPRLWQGGGPCRASGECEKGIVICSTGIGISIAANKVPSIRCALCGDCFSAKATRLHNNANVLALGALVTGPGLALEIVDIFLDTPFSEEERHSRRVSQLEEE